MEINDWSINIEDGGYVVSMTLDVANHGRVAIRRRLTYVYSSKQKLHNILFQSDNFIQYFAEYLSDDRKNEHLIKKDLTKLVKYCILIGIGRII